MADKSKISRRELLTFWRREPAASAPVARLRRLPRRSPEELGWDRPWPRDRVPGPSLGRLLPLRPPGNMHEYILRDACTRCGKCVEVCPADAIAPLDASWGDAAGTPAIDARKSPCVVCEGFKCTHVCPSGSLQPIFNVHQIHMGTASVDMSRCLTYKGEECAACVTVCPVPGAIFETKPVTRASTSIAASAAACACALAPPSPRRSTSCHATERATF